MRTFEYPGDYPAVAALWDGAGPGVHLGRSDSPPEIEKKLRHDPDLFLVAEFGGRIVGSIIGGFDGRRGMMYHLAVEPAARNRGIGDALVQELETRLREKGCLRCYLLVVEDNLAAIDFYEKRGFTRLRVYTLAKDLQ